MLKARASLALTAVTSPWIAAFSFAFVGTQFFAAGQRGIYFTCADDTGFTGEGSVDVTWELSALPTGFGCLHRGEIISFHDVGTAFTIVGLSALALSLLAIVLIVASWVLPRRTRT